MIEDEVELAVREEHILACGSCMKRSPKARTM
jgi:hypothetical protein